ncbi:MAG TPA: PQQ-binding-like beta-propeller repeat protein [Thermoanaerobaculia bacterium]|jgi:outer membrane protein assembly factor BamB|nr:PQQ-binding-like beta-propeller repeat protein [Thermoanaerobaculia bacterium]
MRMKTIAAALAAALLGMPAAFAVDKEPVEHHQRKRPNPFDAGHDWLGFNTAAPDTFGTADRVVTSRNVGDMKLQWKTKLPEAADGSPVYVANVDTQWGVLDLVIVSTIRGRVVALDAPGGAIVWQTTPPAGPRWTTSSPAVDPGKKFVYAYGLDGYIHRYETATGREVTGGGWPELVTLKGDVEKGSSALSLVTTASGKSYLYMTIAAYPDPGDEGDYQGHLVTVDLETGGQKVFNALCSDKAIHFADKPGTDQDCSARQAGIWARAGAVYDGVTDRTFITTGNGTFDAADGGFNWGTCIIALRPDGSTEGGVPLDSYTPTEYQRINDLDLDLSSTTIAILPDVPGLPHLGVQSGKDWLFRLVDLRDLSRRGGPRHLGGELQVGQVPQGGEILSRPAVWLSPFSNRPWVFLSNWLGISAFALTVQDDQPRLEKMWVQQKYASTSPIVANHVLYYAGPHEIAAVNPRTGEKLWSSDLIGGIHWQSPILVNGRLFIADEDANVTAFAIDGRR